MSNLLISESPLQVLPSLAVKIGLNEAIILQQFHYWLQRSNNVRDGRKWIYNSVKEWQKQFPFWKSVTTINKALNHLVNMGLLITGNYNKAGFDKTKWYSINYEALYALEIEDADDGVVNDLPETGKRSTRNCSMEEPETGKPIPIDYQENTTENINSLSRSSATQSGKKEKSKTKLQSSYDDWTAKTNQQLTDLAMHYTKTRVANEQNELAYFNTLMEDWQSRKFETASEVKNYLSNKNGSYSKQPKSNVIKPDWINDDYVEPEPPKPTEEDRKRVEEMLKKYD